jgi:hypothetical protein
VLELNSNRATVQGEERSHVGQRLRLVQAAAADAPGERHRLAWWEVRGLLPPGLAPSAISAAYARATGRPPARDLERRVSRAYSAVELLAALAELERTRRRRPAPPPPPPAPFRSAPPRGVWL